jgi:hypothetical protein
MRHAAGVLWILLLPGCLGNKDPLNPGTPLGTFHVTGTLKGNSCGDELGAGATWAFDIHLSRDHSTLYWDQGGQPVVGQLDASSHATMTSSDTRTIHEANPQRGIGFCGITRDDTLGVTLAGDEASFTGSLSYTFSPSDGSDCTDQLVESGGTFAALPCTTTYDITGAKAHP